MTIDIQYLITIIQYNVIWLIQQNWHSGQSESIEWVWFPHKIIPKT